MRTRLKSLFIIPLLILVLGITGCNPESKGDPESNVNPAPAVEVELSNPETAPEPTSETNELVEESIFPEPEENIIFDPTSPMVLIIPESA